MVRLPPRPTRTDILYPSQTLFRSTRSLSVIISARFGGVNTGEEGGRALIGVTCTAAARAIGANRLAPNIAALPASASLRSIILLPRLRNHGSSPPRAAGAPRCCGTSPGTYGPDAGTALNRPSHSIWTTCHQQN